MKKFNLFKFKMADLWPLLTLICVITGKSCQIAGPLLFNKCAVSGGDIPWKCQLDQIQNGRHAATFDLNISNNWKNLARKLNHYY